MNDNTWGVLYNTIGAQPCAAMSRHVPPCPANVRFEASHIMCKAANRNVSCACSKYYFRGRLMVASLSRPAISTKYTEMLPSSLQLCKRTP